MSCFLVGLLWPSIKSPSPASACDGHFQPIPVLVHSIHRSFFFFILHFTLPPDRTSEQLVRSEPWIAFRRLLLFPPHNPCNWTCTGSGSQLPHAQLNTSLSSAPSTFLCNNYQITYTPNVCCQQNGALTQFSCGAIWIRSDSRNSAGKHIALR